MAGLWRVGRRQETTNGKRRRGCGCGTFLLVILIIVIGLSAMGSFDTPPDAPEPGSDAAQYCDTLETGPGNVQYGVTWYVKECLDLYSWSANE